MKPYFCAFELAWACLKALSLDPCIDAALPNAPNPICCTLLPAFTKTFNNCLLLESWSSLALLTASVTATVLASDCAVFLACRVAPVS